jgi:hypothetical protein
VIYNELNKVSGQEAKIHIAEGHKINIDSIKYSFHIVIDLKCNRASNRFVA